MRLFYSWQSDLPGNRGTIQKCIREALKGFDGFELETATRDTAGSPDIAAAILAKIDASDLLLADVTIINASSRKARQVPNPNVMYELGYALKALGEDNIILVADLATTDASKLPFDIRNRRMILVDLGKPEAGILITSAIADAVRAYKSKGPPSHKTPQVFLSDSDAVWASNHSGHGASFRAVVDVDNYEGRNDYIVDARIEGTNANGTPFATDRFTFEKEEPNHPHPIAANQMQRLVIFMSYDFNNHRPMPDLDRDTTKLTLQFRGGNVITLPIDVRQS